MIGRIFLILLAIFTAVAPLPSGLVEREYSSTLYPKIQAVVTPMSNAFPFAALDILVVFGVTIVLAILLRRRRILNLLAFAALVWLVFLALWGLNYRRVPLESKLSVSPQTGSAEALFMTAVKELNALAPRAHAAEWPQFDVVAARLTDPFGKVRQALGLPMDIVDAVPKRSMLTPYFRAAAIDGFTDPFLLETIVNPDVLPFERPSVVAHEWGHLAGLADESEATFAGWLMCLRGGDQARYSGWLALYPHLVTAVGIERGQQLGKALGPKPREDLRAIYERFQQSSEKVREGANRTYDKFLKANRVEKGIESYDAVVSLITKVRFGNDFSPVLRPGS